MKLAIALIAVTMILPLSGCSNINTPAQISNQIQSEQKLLIVAEQATILAEKQGVLKGSALDNTIKYEQAAATAIESADTAYQGGDTSTASVDMTQAGSALTSAVALLPATATKP